MTERWYRRSNTSLEFLQSWGELSTNHDAPGFMEWLQTTISDAVKLATSNFFIITLPAQAPTYRALELGRWLHEEMYWSVVCRQRRERLCLYLGVHPQVAHSIAFPNPNQS